MDTKKIKLLIYATAAWSCYYGLAGLYWALGGAGFPYGDPAAASMGSLFTAAQPGPGGLLVAVLGFMGAFVAIMLAAAVKSGKGLKILSGFAWLACAILILVVPDVRLLRDFGYSLIGVFQTIDIVSVNQFYCLAGGVLWGGCALVCTRNRLAGKTEGITGPALGAKWRKRGTWAVGIAVLASLPWSIIRLSWFSGYPLGIGQELWDQMNTSVNGTDPGVIKYVFGSLPILGSLLTLGLVQRWGEVIPGWIPFAGGKRVPPALAIAPGALIALVLISAGSRMFGWFIPELLQGGFDMENWGVSLPIIFFLPWGVFLGLATLAYYYRRRGAGAANLRQASLADK